MFLHKSSTWEKCCFGDISQNALSYSDCQIFKSTISLDQIDEAVSFFACYNLTKIKSWLKIICLHMIINGCGQSGLWTLKLIVSQEWTDGTNCFLEAGTISHKLKGDWDLWDVASLVTGLKNWLYHNNEQIE